MPVFIYHPTNAVGKKMREAFEEDGFQYTARPHLENILKDKFAKVGIEIHPSLYFHLGSMSGLSLHQTLDKFFKLDPESNPLHKQIIYHFKSKNPWAYVKMNNGPKMQGVIGFCNSDPSQPFLMSPAGMAQSGIIDTTFVPR